MIDVASLHFTILVMFAWGLSLAIWVAHVANDEHEALESDHSKALAEAAALVNQVRAEAAADDLIWNEMVEALERLADVSCPREAREIAREALGLPHSNWPPLPLPGLAATTQH